MTWSDLCSNSSLAAVLRKGWRSGSARITILQVGLEIQVEDSRACTEAEKREAAFIHSDSLNSALGEL